MSTEVIKSQVVGINAVIASLQTHDLSPCYDLAGRLKTILSYLLHLLKIL